MQLGDNVALLDQRGRIIGLTDLFGQRYADVFIEPTGPVRRVPLDELHLASLGRAVVEYG